MASQLTRAERSGSIFFRVTGLMRAGLLKWDHRPLWYDVYVALPPLREPIWDAKFPKEGEPIRQLLYKEDALRARFYKKYRSAGAISIKNMKTKSASELFIEQHKVEKQENPSLSEEELFAKTALVLQANGIILSTAPSRRTQPEAATSEQTNRTDVSKDT